MHVPLNGGSMSTTASDVIPNLLSLCRVRGFQYSITVTLVTGVLLGGVLVSAADTVPERVPMRSDGSVVK